MNGGSVAFWSDIATITASALAACGLLWTALSLRANAKSNDLASLFMVLREIGEAESRLSVMPENAHEFPSRLNSYLNLLEILAAAINGRLLNKVTRKIAEDRLINDIAIMEADDGARSAFEAAITSPDTFREITLFCRRERPWIASQARMMSGVTVS